MTLTKRMLCFADAEPVGYYAADGNTRYAINLSFECESDNPDTDEPVARTAFETFLDSVQGNVRFFAYELDPGGTLTLQAGPNLPVSREAPTPSIAGELMGWLDQRGKSTSQFWTRAPAARAQSDVVEAEAADAAALLRSAHAWNAPVGHRCGLTYVVEVPSNMPPASYVILPHFGTELLPPPLSYTTYGGEAAAAGSRLDVTGNFGSSIVDLLCQTAIPTPPHSETLGGRLTDSGYFLIDEDASALHRLLNAFEHRAASLLSVPPALISNDSQHQDTDYEILFVQTDGKPAPIASWAAVMGLLSGLDNLAIALLRPVSRAHTEGELLAPLIEFIGQTPDAQARAAILQAVRNALRQSPLLAPEAQDGHDSRIREANKELIQALRYVYGLADTADETSTLDIRLLQALLDAAVGGQYSDELLNALKGGSVLGLLNRALSGLVAQLSEESGAEAAIIRLFESAARFGATSKESVAALLFEQLPGIPQDQLNTAWNRYCALLNGPFNGAEAIRRGASLEFLHAIFLQGHMRKVNVLATPTSLRVASEIQQDMHFLARLSRSSDFANGLFAAIRRELVLVPNPQLPEIIPAGADRKGRNALEVHLYNAYAATMLGIGDLRGEGDRFIADLTPQPLPLQISGDLSGELIAGFLDDFNGIAIAIARDDNGDGAPTFAHADLAELHWGKGTHAEVPAALHPILPSTSDGRGPVFIEYHGLPFADTSLASVLANPTVSAQSEEQLPFYRVSVVSTLVDQPPLPRLAYGRWFHSFAFALTNAGVPPVLQRPASGLPWLPGNPKRPCDSATVTRTPYQRRTALGEVEMTEFDETARQALPKEQQRLNRSFPDVVALASDYPRTSLVAPVGTRNSLDLYREHDGIGALALAREGVSRTLQIAIGELQISGLGAKVTLEFWSNPAQTPIASLELTADEIHASSLMLTLTSAAPEQAGDRFHQVTVSLTNDQSTEPHTPAPVFKVEQAELCWLRVVLEAGNTSAALHCATPEGPKGSAAAPALILLAPEGSYGWRPEFTQKKVLMIRTPRVGYLDFERWMANSTLRDDALKAGGSANGADFTRELMALYRMRNANDRLAHFFDRLPDPAVSKLRLTLCETDRLERGASLPALSWDVDLLKLGGKNTTLGGIGNKFSVQQPGAIENLLKGIEEKFRIKVSISVGPAALKDAGEREIDVALPAGTSAHLTIEALVPATCFDGESDSYLPPIHPGLLQHACGKSEEHYIFPLSTICIEAMPAQLLPSSVEELAGRMIGIAAAANARRYDIVAAQQAPVGADRNAWRLYSHIDVTSQRWLYSGRPLYRALKPRAVAWGDENAVPTTAATRLKNDNALVGEFEDELFFDRSNLDANTLPCRLAPLPTPSVLQTFTWDAPSATYWRHRFTLKSRYAGALLRPEKGLVPAFTDPKWNEGPTHANWTLRVAMLADRARIQLTRPQLRALIPLTTGVDRDTPSVLAVLQEPPLAQGGLADRVSAELKTGLGYGFATTNSPVEILDVRKEVGPDPTLTYSAMPPQEANALVLAAEGPIGLTFDPAHAAAPAFANSMFTLTPTSLRNQPTKPLEEYFLGIVLQRHLDPDWLADDPIAVASDKSTETAYDPGQCWWIEIDIIAEEGALLAGDSGEVLSFKRNKDGVRLEVSKKSVDGVTGANHSKVDVVTLPIGNSPLALLHQPTAPDHYGLSIFIKPQQADIAKGHSAAWLKVASIEWTGLFVASPELPGKAPARSQLILPVGARVRACAASASTFLAWARTLRDFANLTIRTSGQEDGRAQASDLVTRYDSKGAMTFHYRGASRPLRLAASTATNPVPINRHRHLAYLVTRLRDEPGRPVEEFKQFSLFVGTDASLIDRNIDGRLNVRVVEIEPPAVILCGTDIQALPPEFRNRQIDLVSTGGSSPGQLRLFLRFVGTGPNLPTTLYLRLLKAGEVPVIGNSVTLDPGGKPLSAIEICLARESGSCIRLLDNDGKVLQRTPSAQEQQWLKGQAGALAGNPGSIHLRLDAPKERECWCDVSLLHSATGVATNQVDIDWLFSRDTPDPLERALQPAALEARTEAQARIVSVSPPIPLEKNF